MFLNILGERALEPNNLAVLIVSLSECYCMLENFDKAINIMNIAYKHLKNTEYEGEIKLAESKICLHKNDTVSALKILNAIQSDENTFIKVCFSV